MKTPFPMLLACLAITSGAAAHQPVPKDVKAFIANAETCEHVAGEWDSDLSEAEKGAISRSVRRYCGAAQEQFSALKKKYKRDQHIVTLLEEKANDSVRSYIDKR